ncbi:putative THO complex subunit 2 isoform X1 [Sesbania bispinosa]|nr:putative THO complex subunit 2 isoform X1 [Sesbania bispinosa]
MNRPSSSPSRRLGSLLHHLNSLPRPLACRSELSNTVFLQIGEDQLRLVPFVADQSHSPILPSFFFLFTGFLFSSFSSLSSSSSLFFLCTGFSSQIGLFYYTCTCIT